MEQRNFYDILGISETATEEEIRAAFRKKAFSSHPDRGGSNDQMAAVNDAWAVLGDASKRAAYDSDRRRAASGPSSPFTYHSGDQPVYRTAYGNVRYRPAGNPQGQPPSYRYSQQTEVTTGGCLFIVAGAIGGIYLLNFVTESMGFRSVGLLWIFALVFGARAGKRVYEFLREGVESVRSRTRGTEPAEGAGIPVSKPYFVLCKGCRSPIQMPGGFSEGEWLKCENCQSTFYYPRRKRA